MNTPKSVAGITKLSELTIDTQGYFKTDIATVATALNGTATADGALYLALMDAYVATVCNHTNLTAANLNLFCDHANIPSAKIKAILDTASVTVASQLGAMLEGMQLTTANASNVCQNKYTTAQINAAFDNAIMSSDREQAIMYQMITDHYFQRLIDIITDGQSDVTISANTQIEDTTIYKDLTVDSGFTLTLHTASDSKSGIIIARTITNDGTITRTAQGAAGGARGTDGAGEGKKGGAGLIIVVKTLDNNNIISAPGINGETGTTVVASGNGGNGSNGALYRVGTDTPGAGGDCTSVMGGISGAGSDRGAGVGGNNAAGTATYTTNTGAEINDLIFKATVDYFIETVQSKAAPSLPQAFIDVYNSGSGGGTGSDGTGAGGGGGSGGGEVLIACDTYDNTGGTISADAANGGNGGTEGTADCGGGGGGGGLIYVLYKTQTAAGTLQVALGTGGTGDHAGNNGAVGTTSAIDITA